jgi:RimJ/RimL family protein N-acetyltransferase
MFKEYGFSTKQSDSIISIIHKDNLRSQNVALKNGMKKEKETEWNGLPIYIFRT